MDQVAASEQPIDISQTAPSGIHAHNGSGAFVLIQLQGRFSSQDQGLQGACQLRLAIKETIDDDFPIAAGQHAAQLSAAPVALFGKVAFGGKGRFGTAGQTTHIDIERLKAGLVVMRVTLTLLAINAVYGLFHLLHMLCCRGIQRVLHHRLLSTAAAPESSLQAHIGSQSRIDLDQSMGTGQDADQGVIKFVAWPILDGLLSNLHLLCNRLKELQFGQLDANGSQAGTARKRFRRHYGRFVHDDDAPIATFSLFDRYASSSCFWQAPFWWLSATNWGQI